ncbi:BMP family ABC transporter substrate-binding protein [Microvirga sp. W0021]|uniref:BMP family ABC transporter substrate-binding protein n=2 Tax=Hohaiivirga grylli TaxID=3133970 RepID=A0ABV0BJB3_9HYPH
MALAASSGVSAEEKLKVGFIYIGPIGDYGYSYQHNEGRKALEKALGDKVETTYVEGVSEADAERPIEQLARTGHKLIFTNSFGFMEATLKVAKKYPNVKFEHATGYKRAANVATYAARFYEGRYIQGQIAAKMSKTGIIGYLAAFPIPECVAGINAYMLGAQSVRPDIKLKVVWANTWYDPAKEADAAKALFDQNVDVITQHTDSPAPLQTAEARGKFGFGQASDMEQFAPKAQLTALVNDWSEYYIERTKLVLDGKWTSTDTWDGLDKKMIVMSPYKNMPDDVKKMAEETEAAIASHKLKPFKCPVLDQSGKEVECKGEGTLSDEQILGMNFYVKGIEDKLPQ